MTSMYYRVRSVCVFEEAVAILCQNMQHASAELDKKGFNQPIILEGWLDGQMQITREGIESGLQGTPAIWD